MRVILPLALFASLLAGPAASADRTQVYSIQGVDCGDCGTGIKAALKRLKGVKKAVWDVPSAEITVTLADRVTDQAILEAVANAGEGFHAVVGAGQGAYLPTEKYPEDADVVLLTKDGSTVGSLEKLRVPGKITVFDVYADWCGPCRAIDATLRETVTERKDVAVRKLNVVRFDSPLARELGPRFKALPYVIVYSASGKRTEIVGVDMKKLAAALATQ